MNEPIDYNQIAHDFAVIYGIGDYEVIGNIMIYSEDSDMQNVETHIQRNLDTGNEIKI